MKLSSHFLQLVLHLFLLWTIQVQGLSPAESLRRFEFFQLLFQHFNLFLQSFYLLLEFSILFVVHFPLDSHLL